MNSGSKSLQLLASASGPRANTYICLSCQASISRQQRHASAAAAAIAHEPLSSPQVSPDASESASPALRPAYRLLAGVILSRPPQLTRALTPFEKSFYLYQRRLNERLALPFTRYFYFKRDTPADLEWKRKIKTRLTPAKEIGVYSGYGENAWNDELLVGAPESETEHQIEALVNDVNSEVPAVGEGEQGSEGGEQQAISGDTAAAASQSKKEKIEAPLSRVTEADRKGDLRSLDRKGERTLYLLVKNQEGRWTLPQARVGVKESFNMAAERVLVQTAGVNMNTWVVGNVPIGMHQYRFPNKTVQYRRDGVEESGERTFFMKARMMAGQADLAQNAFGDTDFHWLTKDEIESFVTRPYYSSIRNILADR
ncbi:MAG: 54S ribosomal protein L17 mitochondrial [Bogoriella megaspora]|nr:MAG: 54S ribosomal protein L17 mitochondrial [Bogoriella megaspora]